MKTTKKIALVTGGSRGLGKNMALSLARKGVGIVITYHSKKDDALAVVSELEKLGVTGAALQLNTGDVSSFPLFITALTSVLESKFGTDRFDFLINNAGVGLHKSFAETTEDEFDNLLNIHFKGVFFLTQRSLPLINDGGTIVNLSSGLARFTVPGMSAYASMKGGVEILTKYLAKELGARKISVNIVAPGAVETDFSGGLVRDNPDYNKMVAGMTALGRAGLPDDIGGVVSFLCSDDAHWINGQRIEVSGGANL